MAAWRHGSVDVVLAEFIVEETRRVLPRLRHRHRLSDGEIDDLVDALSIQAELLSPLPIADPDLRDGHDLPILGTLLAAVAAGGIDYLITGDKDLLVLADRYPVLSPAEFWSRHGGP